MGIKIKVNKAEVARPPSTAEPNPLYNSLPDPVEVTKGNIPKTVVAVVIKIGRILSPQLSKIAAFIFIPERKQFSFQNKL